MALAFVLAVAGLTAGVQLAASTPAHADYASGVGRYAGSIYWLDWTSATGLTNGQQVNNGTTLTVNPLPGYTVTATLSAVTASAGRSVRATPQDGTYSEIRRNGYNTGSQWSVLTPNAASAQATFTVTMSAVFNGRPVPVDVIAADGESAGPSEQITFTSNGSPWQNIDNTTRAGAAMWRQNNFGLGVNGGFGTQTMGNWVTDIGNAAGMAPIGVSMGPRLGNGQPDGPTQVGVSINSSGLQNVMLGLMLPVDRGDAPTSFGDASHLLSWTPEGDINAARIATGQAGASGVVFNGGATPYLGTVAPDGDAATRAAGFQTWTTDDSLTAPSIGDEGGTQLTGLAGSGFPALKSCENSYSVTVIAKNANGKLAAAWMDWNNNGVFDPSEKSPAVVGANEQVTFTWAHTPIAGTSTGVGARFRIATAQADIAEATGSAQDGEVEDYLVPVTACPSLSVVKSANKNSVAAVGETVAYSFSVTNSGDVALSNVVVNDAKVSATPLPVTPATLAAGATGTATASYQVTQADIDAGTLSNTATAGGTPPTGPAVSSAPSTKIVSTPVRASALTIVKSADRTMFGSLGEVIRYTFTVRNTGNTTLTNATVTDARVGMTARAVSPATLAPGQSGTAFVDYTVTTADVTAGSIRNVATATATPPAGAAPIQPASSNEVLTPRQNPALTVVKAATEGDFDAVGDTLNYSFTVTNSGNVPLTGVSVSDPRIGATALAVTPSTLAPGGTGTATAVYTVTQADLNNGSVVNTATVTGTPPAGSPALRPTSSNQVTVPAVQKPSLTLGKSSTTTKFATVGQRISYVLEVRNNGNVAVQGIVLNDLRIGAANVDLAPATLQPGGTGQLTINYTVTQADLDAGRIVNTANVSGTGPRGQAVGPISSNTVTIPADQKPSLQVVKSLKQSAFAAAGDVLDYTFAVTNNGNVTMNAVAVADARIDVGSLAVTPATLAPGQAGTATAKYTVKQADVDSGRISNIASVTGKQPGAELPIAPQSSNVVVVAAPANPAMTFVKSADKSSVAAAGEKINYTFKVTNTGNVTMSQLTVADPRVGAQSIAVTPASLAPGAFGSATVEYVVTQADVDAGVTKNIATVAGSAPAGGESLKVPSNEVVTPAVQASALTIKKSATVTALPKVGENITYQFVVTNTGNTTISDVSVADEKVDAGTLTFGGKTVAAPSGITLAPTEQAIFQATHKVTQADVDAGDVVNTATATGVPPLDKPLVESTPDTVNLPGTDEPALTVQKSADAADFAEVGQELEYSFTVTNTGNVTMSAITVADPRIGAENLEVTPSTLAPGQSGKAQAKYTVTQDDLDSGAIVNTASTTGTPPRGTEPIAAVPSNTLTTPAVQSPAMTVVKSAKQKSFAAAGDTLEFSFLVTNTGNVTLNDATVSDARIGVDKLAVGVLAPGQSATVSAKYVTTAADVKAGKVVNTATTTALVAKTTKPLPPVASNTVTVKLGKPLANTGATSMVLAVGGALLLAGGLLFMQFSRRRTRS
ncbi:CshA/CshB family fibrillar adhesin-related protein [Arthrobacter sp. HLT1-20]